MARCEEDISDGKPLLVPSPKRLKSARKREYQFGFCEPVYYTASHALLFSRYLGSNQLTELPEGLFSTTTQLQYL